MKVITFTAADGTACAMFPAPDSQLPDETDDAFAARIMTKDLPAGSTDAQVIDSSAYVPVTSLRDLVAATMAAGCQIASTGTPAVNGTYKVDAPAKATIDGIYAGIKGGDGLPGGGATFNYADIGGQDHPFDAPTFLDFAKAVRDFLYALSQGRVPTQPVTIA